MTIKPPYCRLHKSMTKRPCLQVYEEFFEMQKLTLCTITKEITMTIKPQSLVGTMTKRP